ncbi:glutamate carboxypeptidase [Catenulispora sp. EB89]|uniref:M20 family metallopeptidase n=1 Tax=Catenulispora sp. EB89 TaxID=3156257 RepID=UPI003518F164
MTAADNLGTGPAAATERAVSRLAELVGHETPSGYAAGLHACYDLLTSWAPAGLGTPHRMMRDEVPHLFWPKRSGAPGGVLLLCHADTVWPLGTLAERPFARQNGRLTGPGAFDMKAGLVIGWEALALAADSGGLEHVSVLVTGDEETGSPTSRALVESAAADCSAVLVLEPGEGDAAKVARKGVGLYRIAVQGRASHAGLEPEAGVNALIELASQVLAVAGLGDSGAGTTVTPTVASAGTTTNTVPEAAAFNVDVRAWQLTELQRVDAALHALVPRHPEARLEVSGGINRAPLEQAMSADLLDLAQEVSRERGLPSLGAALVGGGSDGNFTAGLGIPTLDGLGPRGAGAHARHEWVAEESLLERAALVAGLIEALR